MTGNPEAEIASSLGFAPRNDKRGHRNDVAANNAMPELKARGERNGVALDMCRPRNYPMVIWNFNKEERMGHEGSVWSLISAGIGLVACLVFLALVICAVLGALGMGGFPNKLWRATSWYHRTELHRFKHRCKKRLLGLPAGMDIREYHQVLKELEELALREGVSQASVAAVIQEDTRLRIQCVQMVLGNITEQSDLETVAMADIVAGIYGSFEPQIGRIANKAYQLRLNQNKADFARLQSELDAILGELGLLISTALEEPDRQLYPK